MKKILVLNWAMSKETSWHWSLFKGLVDQYDYKFTIISGRKHWEPRGGGICKGFEEEKGIKCYRIFKDIDDFKINLSNKKKEIVKLIGKDFDFIICFHQANLKHAKNLQRELKIPIVLIVEQAFRISGVRNGTINDGWKQKLKETAKIISWSPQDIENEKTTGVKYLPFGGCFDKEDLSIRSYEERRKEAIAIYQGSICGGFKNQEDFLITIPKILKETPIKKFIINGYPLAPEAQSIIDKLKKQFPNRIEHSIIKGRLNVIESLSRAFVGYCPVSPTIMCNFPIECFAVGVPILLNKIEQKQHELFLNSVNQINELFDSKEIYGRYYIAARIHYELNHSLSAMTSKYNEVFKRIGE